MSKINELIERITERIADETALRITELTSVRNIIHEEAKAFDEYLQQKNMEELEDFMAEYEENKAYSDNDGWISCSSGNFPKEPPVRDTFDPSEEVLVYVYYGENCVNNGCAVSRYWSHSKYHENPWIDLNCRKENVTHWRPLFDSPSFRTFT